MCGIEKLKVEGNPGFLRSTHRKKKSKNKWSKSLGPHPTLHSVPEQKKRKSPLPIPLYRFSVQIIDIEMYWGSLIFFFPRTTCSVENPFWRGWRLPSPRRWDFWCCQSSVSIGQKRMWGRTKKKRTKGWRSIDLYSRNLCRQTEHPSCCAGSFQTARGPWSTCRTPRPRSSPPPLGWCSSQLGWSGGPALWRTPVRKRERPGRVRWGEKLEPQTIPMGSRGRGGEWKLSSGGYLLVLLKAEVESRCFVFKGAVSAEVSCPDL